MTGINLAEEMALKGVGRRKRIHVGYPKGKGFVVVVVVCHILWK